MKRRETPQPPPEPAPNVWHDWQDTPPPMQQHYDGFGPIIDAWVKKYEPESDSFRFFRVPDLRWRDRDAEFTNLPKDVRPVAWMRVEGPTTNQEIPA